MENGGCHHKCLNLPGSFRCECNDGYQVNSKDKVNKNHAKDISDVLFFTLIVRYTYRQIENEFSRMVAMN
jgi:hypothetical protein